MCSLLSFNISLNSFLWGRGLCRFLGCVACFGSSLVFALPQLLCRLSVLDFLVLASLSLASYFVVTPNAGKAVTVSCVVCRHFFCSLGSSWRISFSSAPQCVSSLSLSLELCALSALCLRSVALLVFSILVWTVVLGSLSVQGFSAFSLAVIISPFPSCFSLFVTFSSSLGA